jgi:serine/threonine-protein kinase
LSAERLGSLVLGRFRLTALLATGGQGEVYAGLEQSTGQRVAVKMARRDALDLRVEERLQIEGEVLAEVRCPGVVRLVTMGFDPALRSFCLIKELVPGVPLTLLLDRGERLSVQEVRSLARQVAEGMESLHRAGFLMRDMSPSQVMVDGAGESLSSVIVDLGMVRRKGEAEGLTDPAQLAGTPGYVAPEVGDGAPVTPAADAYSLAALIFHLLAGFGPFGEGRPESTLAMQLIDAADALPPRHDLDEGARLRVQEVLHRALAHLPAARPATPRVLVDALEEALGGPHPDWFGRLRRFLP